MRLYLSCRGCWYALVFECFRIACLCNSLTFTQDSPLFDIPGTFNPRCYRRLTGLAETSPSPSVFTPKLCSCWNGDIIAAVLTFVSPALKIGNSMSGNQWYCCKPGVQSRQPRCWLEFIQWRCEFLRFLSPSVFLTSAWQKIPSTFGTSWKEVHNASQNFSLSNPAVLDGWADFKI